MTTMLKSLLFKSEMPMPFLGIPGRKILFDVVQPDIHIVTGPVPERIVNYLKAKGEPATAIEIVRGIASSVSKVNAHLKTLVEDGWVLKIAVPGCVTEYQYI